MHEIGAHMSTSQAPPTDGAPQAESPSLAVICVRALMDRHGLPKYRQSAWLADALGLSYSQAHRRMTGATRVTLTLLASAFLLMAASRFA